VVVSDPRFRVPPSTRPILPSWPRRAAFALLGVFAALVRVLTLPWRVRRRDTHRRIVVLEPYGMGDVLALQPLVRAWCEAGREVVVGTRAEWHPLLVPHPNLTCLGVRPAWTAADPRRKYRGLWSGAGGLPALTRRLRPVARGARGVDVRGDVRSVILLYLAGCGTVETLTHYFTANDCLVFPLAARRRPVDRTVERWRLNAVFAADEGLSLEPPSVEHLRSPVAESVPGRVGLVPLTPWIGKQWQPAAWREVAEGLRARGRTPVVLCGPGDRAAATAAVGGALPVDEVADVAGWVAALARCAAVLCVNTGPMHIAAALGVPLVVVEGSSRLPLWAPASATARVVHHQDVAGCAPCHQIGDTVRCASRCMALVGAAEVLAALDDVCPR
jgi:ADP-heptose:LPS heptosyltransferase